MKFAARIDDSFGLNRLLAVVMCVKAVSKNCVIRLAPDSVQLMIMADLSDGSFGVWATLQAAMLFSNYTLTSKHPNNEILFEISLDLLSKALRVTTQSGFHGCDMKFVKSHGSPCLSIEANMVTGHHDGAAAGGNPTGFGAASVVATFGERQVVQQVPVSILRHNQSERFQKPAMALPAVSVDLPDNRKVRGVVEKMQKMGQFLTIAANQSGDLDIKVDTDMVTATTSFHDLPTTDVASVMRPGEQTGPEDPKEMVEARVDAKKCAHFLHGMEKLPTVFKNYRNVLNIIPGEAVVLLAMAEGLSIQNHLAVMAADNDA